MKEGYGLVRECRAICGKHSIDVTKLEVAQIVSLATNILIVNELRHIKTRLDEIKCDIKKIK